MRTDQEEVLTDEERAKMFGVSLEEFLAHRTGVINAYRAGNPLAVKIGAPVIVEVVENTGEVESVKKA